jgi:hypothetical protein
MILLLILIVLVWYLLPRYQHPVVLRNMLTSEECEHIKKQALPRLHPSTVGGKHQVNTNIRQSDTAWLNGKDDPVVKDIIKRLIKHVDRPVSNCEHLQVLRYKPGGYYKPHYDAFQNECTRSFWPSTTTTKGVRLRSPRLRRIIACRRAIVSCLKTSTITNSSRGGRTTGVVQ